MADKYQSLREAAGKATQGKWTAEARVGDWVICSELDTYALAYPDPSRGQQSESNALFIAQANPATIQALLAERDAFRDVVLAVAAGNTDADDLEAMAIAALAFV